MAEFSGSLKFKGSREDCDALFSVLKEVAVEQYKNYCSDSREKPCWYIEPDYNIEKYLKSRRGGRENWQTFVEQCDGKISFDFSGPWGYFNSLWDDVDLFNKIAKAAPSSEFEGSISGWDWCASFRVEARFEGGNLQLSNEIRDADGDY